MQDLSKILLHSQTADAIISLSEKHSLFIFKYLEGSVSDRFGRCIHYSCIAGVPGKSSHLFHERLKDTHEDQKNSFYVHKSTCHVAVTGIVLYV